VGAGFKHGLQSLDKAKKEIWEHNSENYKQLTSDVYIVISVDGMCPR
jgi:hypothetical protein